MIHLTSTVFGGTSGNRIQYPFLKRSIVKQSFKGAQHSG